MSLYGRPQLGKHIKAHKGKRKICGIQFDTTCRKTAFSTVLVDPSVYYIRNLRTKTSKPESSTRKNWCCDGAEKKLSDEPVPPVHAEATADISIKECSRSYGSRSKSKKLNSKEETALIINDKPGNAVEDVQVAHDAN